ncbi:hypothetical protein ACSYDW_14525 [Paeniglutamicibacter sp. R2-26]|uniref:hypothetical protein n=1 Tax=Paeniglutamicibacter sp. R2-26 TaxID=3144417 RepID=UPI003EE5D359
MEKKTYGCVALGFVALATLTSCASGGESPAPAPATVTVTATAAPAPAPATVPTPTPTPKEAEEAEQATPSDSLIAEVGTALVNHGIGLTVNEAKIVKTIPINHTTYDPESSYAIFTDEKPGSGGKYLQVRTSIENTGSSSLDLTCSWPIEIFALDTRSRQYDPIEELYNLKGNPGCSSNLQPGFKDKMTYAFLVPKDAELAGLIFRDTSVGDVDFSIVRFDPTLK